MVFILIVYPDSFEKSPSLLKIYANHWIRVLWLLICQKNRPKIHIVHHDVFPEIDCKQWIVVGLIIGLPEGLNVIIK